MKAPIPEKIDKGLVGCLITPDVVNSINSLIDVVTEQQKEIERLKKSQEGLIKGLLKRDAKYYSTQPYTAMRSTGECVRCGHDHEQDDYPACSCCNTLAPKYIKPQEDIRENIGKIINEYWGNGYQIGKHGAFSAKTMETDTVVDRILAIVKGE